MLLVLWGSGASALEPAAARPAVTLFVVGDPEARASVQAWARQGAPGVPVTLRLAELPAATARPGGEAQLLEAERRLQQARRHYINAEFADCLQDVGDEGGLPRALSQGRREVAARWLLWQVACHLGLGREETALQAASELGVLGLEPPADLGVLPPEVGRVLVAGAEQGAARGRTTLRISADSGPARISLDGRLGVCTAPCSLEVLEGRHVLRVDAEGRHFAVQVVSARGPELPVAFTTVPASPELAAGQWSTHYGDSSANLDSAGSLSLLSTALRAPRLVLLTAEAEQEGVRLRGALALDGRAAARTERRGDARALDATAEGVLRDLLVQGRVVEPAPALYQRRDFWIAVGVAALIAGATTTALLWRQPVRTEVGF
ncbi:PEGA domain-containing protein [Myxococcus sp. MISCRS1]|uniref:PEGA domain-containing protein n=1 Tax=Myxococcus sp. MISCRS1 TaxID=2996786 RepID=UPI00226E8C05|nr:PEGA domain-containing protein [Myxococcus sp. MISCRS1]MCY0997895.1 PEGA domain-containing protein [Myxococcus sp. MISCRS1]